MTEDTNSGASPELREEVMHALFVLLREDGYEIKDDTRVFRHTFIGEIGTVVIDFEMDTGFVDWAIRTSGGIVDGILDHAAETLISEGKMVKKPDQDEPPQPELAALIAFLAIKGMPEKLGSAFRELGIEVETFFKAMTLAQMEKTGFPQKIGFELPSIAKEVKAVIKDFANERGTYLTKQIDSLTGKPRLDKLPEVYPALLKVWQSAKKIYESNSESETWRDMVKAKYPDHNFDDDLLTRVTRKIEDLPEDIQLKLIETDGDHTPSTIALEHAARICGATHYQYGTRYYHRLKTGKVKTELSETE